MNTTDEEVKRDVVDELYWDDSVDASDISVAVDRGVVSLSGTVPSHRTAASAVEDARRVYGVTEVQNHLGVSYPGTAPVTDDVEIQSRIQNAFSLDPDIDSLDIRVGVEDGMVTLDGSISALWKKFHAEDIASRQPGVVTIRNNMAVVPTKDVRDKEIADNILASLKRKRLLAEEDIDIQVKNGVVELTGLVPTWIARRVVNETARYTPGVLHVVDNMGVALPRQ
jgi:osmotically-inducible protein OsmY